MAWRHLTVYSENKSTAPLHLCYKTELQNTLGYALERVSKNTFIISELDTLE